MCVLSSAQPGRRGVGQKVSLHLQRIRSVSDGPGRQSRRQRPQGRGRARDTLHLQVGVITNTFFKHLKKENINFLFERDKIHRPGGGGGLRHAQRRLLTALDGSFLEEGMVGDGSCPHKRHLAPDQPSCSFTICTIQLICHTV